MTKKAIWITASLLIIYFAFTSGFVYWATRCQETEKLIMPYSYALSAKEQGLAGVTTKADMDCVKWLLRKSDKSIEIAGDTNVIFLLEGYFESYYVDEDRFAPIENFDTKEHCYLFLNEWNIEHSKYLLSSDVGLREQYSFTIVDGIIYYEVYNSKTINHREIKSVPIIGIYQSENARIYVK